MIVYLSMLTANMVLGCMLITYSEKDTDEKIEAYTAWIALSLIFPIVWLVMIYEYLKSKKFYI